MAVAATTVHATRTENLASGLMTEYAHAHVEGASFPSASVAAVCPTISKFEYRNPKQIQNTKKGNDLSGIRFKFTSLNIRYTESFRVLATFCRSCFVLRISSFPVMAPRGRRFQQGRDRCHCSVPRAKRCKAQAVALSRSPLRQGGSARDPPQSVPRLGPGHPASRY